jgi:peptide/nickel transport system substrate-binding protein
MTRSVNLVNDLPSTSLANLKFEGSFSYSLVPTNGRLLHVQFNHEKRSRAGDAANPFADVRVRQALALALDRPAIAAAVEIGAAQAADTIVPTNFDEGVVRWRQIDFYGPLPAAEMGPDPVGAKHLLQQAGLSSGFKTTLAAPARFTDVAKRMLAQLKGVGIDARLVPWSEAENADLRLADWPGWTGELSMPLKALAFRHDPKNGLGTDNWGGYGNPALEASVKAALAIDDDAARRKALRRAEQVALADAALVPVLFVNESWGQYHGIAFDTRMTQRSIFAQHIVGCVPCHDLNP